MSQRSSSCPSCGAQVTFTWSSAIQTTCEFCHSIIVRTDVDVELVGKVADLPPSVSPIQIGTEGIYRNRPFRVTGRIVYEWEQGGWNEWHILFGDNSSGWLSDAQAEYAVSFAIDPKQTLPVPDQLQPGQQFTFNSVPFEVTTLTQAHYVGVQGELPIQYWDKKDVLFADLRSQKGEAFATIDYSESPPLVFAGETVDFASLKPKNLRDLSQGAQVGAQSVTCPNCGGPVEIRAAGQTVSVVCIQCLSILDATQPKPRLIQQFHAAQRVAPLIPLGKKGKIAGDTFENIGFQCRYTEDEGERFEWREYVLFNPMKGFRYLSEYNGHWNDVVTIQTLPQRMMSGGRNAVRYNNEVYKHFQGAPARTSYVIGEFPWRVRVGEVVFVDDYISPPRMLSSEKNQKEITWSLGEYVPGDTIWKAFSLPGAAPPAIGVFENQPSPYTGQVRSAWLTFLVLALALMGSCTLAHSLMQDKQVLEVQKSFTPGTSSENSYVTPVFEVTGRPSNLEVAINTDLDNGWVYFNLALINDETGETWDWGREISYYHGRDSDGSWSEGKAEDVSTLPRIPAGTYYLRIEPEWSPTPGTSTTLSTVQTVRYRLKVKRDVPLFWPYIVGFFLLPIPAVWKWVRSLGFETKRWKESDSAPTSSGGE